MTGWSWVWIQKQSLCICKGKAAYSVPSIHSLSEEPLGTGMHQLFFICCYQPVYLRQIHPLLVKKISSLAENTSPRTVFDEVLAAAGRDTVTKDISRLRGGWPMQDAFYVSLSLFSVRTSLPHHCTDCSLFSFDLQFICL